MTDPKVDPAEVVKDAVAVGSQIAANPKGFWKSKTFWIMSLIAAAHYFGFLPPQATPYVATGAAIALRLISSGSVSLTGQ